MRELRPHDLVRLTPDAAKRIAASAPPWVGQSLSATPWATVRRAHADRDTIAIGIRGFARHERYAATACSEDLLEAVTPEALAQRTPMRQHAAFVALATIERTAAACGLRMGPIGAAAYEIATRTQALHESSDLDVIVRASPSNPALRTFASALRDLSVRVDVEVAFGNRYGVSLDELLAGNDVLVKTPSGPRRMRIATVADVAVQALLDEAELTPKPALVDRRGSGAHADLTLELLLRSARSLHETFGAIAAASRDTVIGIALRERLGAIGRSGEQWMMNATAGINTHRGAIWTLGLLVAGQSATASYDPRRIAEAGASIARLPDRARSALSSNGERARDVYGVRGTIGEAESAFPHVIDVALPALHRARTRGEDENTARVNALLAIMTTLDDTCLLHRGGLEALTAAQNGARAVLEAGGVAISKGQRAFAALEATLLERNASPGGAADLLAAALFLDTIAEQP
jgi:triphosphoribosyl-dephospho-CoA synthase